MSALMSALMSIIISSRGEETNSKKRIVSYCSQLQSFVLEAKSIIEYEANLSAGADKNVCLAAITETRVWQLQSLQDTLAL